MDAISGYDDWKLASPYEDEPDEVEFDEERAREFLEGEGLAACEECKKPVQLIAWTKWRARNGAEAVRVVYCCHEDGCEEQGHHRTIDKETRTWAEIQAERAEAEHDRRREDW